MKENLELLAKRFDEMALAREDVAAKKRWSNCKSAAIVPLESAALAYRRCASEVRMLANDPNDIDVSNDAPDFIAEQCQTFRIH